MIECKHEWLRHGDMSAGEFLCINCGVWQVLEAAPSQEPVYVTHYEFLHKSDAAAQIADLQRQLDWAWESAQSEADALDKANEQIAKLEFALENCRLLAARKRKEDWALLILGFCAEGGVVGSVTR